MKSGTFWSILKRIKGDKKSNDTSSMTIFGGVTPSGPLIGLVIKSNYFLTSFLEHSTVSEKCRLNL